MADPKLVDGKLNLKCTHGYTSWEYCASCCTLLADMVPGLLREIDTLRARITKGPARVPPPSRARIVAAKKKTRRTS